MFTTVRRIVDSFLLYEGGHYKSKKHVKFADSVLEGAYRKSRSQQRNSAGCRSGNSGHFAAPTMPGSFPSSVRDDGPALAPTPIIPTGDGVPAPAMPNVDEAPASAKQTVDKVPTPATSTGTEAPSAEPRRDRKRKHHAGEAEMDRGAKRPHSQEASKKSTSKSKARQQGASVKSRSQQRNSSGSRSGDSDYFEPPRMPGSFPSSVRNDGPALGPTPKTPTRDGVPAPAMPDVDEASASAKRTTDEVPTPATSTGSEAPSAEPRRDRKRKHHEEEAEMDRDAKRPHSRKASKKSTGETKARKEIRRKNHATNARLYGSQRNNNDFSSASETEPAVAPAPETSTAEAEPATETRNDGKRKRSEEEEAKANEESKRPRRERPICPRYSCEWFYLVRQMVVHKRRGDYTLSYACTPSALVYMVHHGWIELSDAVSWKYSRHMLGEGLLELRQANGMRKLDSVFCFMQPSEDAVCAFQKGWPVSFGPATAYDWSEDELDRKKYGPFGPKVAESHKTTVEPLERLLGLLLSVAPSNEIVFPEELRESRDLFLPLMSRGKIHSGSRAAQTFAAQYQTPEPPKEKEEMPRKHKTTVEDCVEENTHCAPTNSAEHVGPIIQEVEQTNGPIIQEVEREAAVPSWQHIHNEATPSFEMPAPVDVAEPCAADVSMETVAASFPQTVPETPPASSFGCQTDIGTRPVADVSMGEAVVVAEPAPQRVEENVPTFSFNLAGPAQPQSSERPMFVFTAGGSTAPSSAPTRQAERRRRAAQTRGSGGPAQNRGRTALRHPPVRATCT